jgi:SAM-dependent methyltransferase
VSGIDILRKTIRPSYRLVRRLVVGQVVDRRLGVDTAREVRLDRLGLSGSEWLGYEASGWRVLPRILPPPEVGADDVFLDYGSGKGRVLFQAAYAYPFKRVIGIELSPELNEIAASNIEHNQSRLRCPDVQIITGDAAAYRIPDDVTVIYLYNPFRGATFSTVVDNIVDSLDRRPRGLRMVYKSPLEEERLLGTGRFRLVRERRGVRPGRNWARASATRLYESTAF